MKTKILIFLLFPLLSSANTRMWISFRAYPPSFENSSFTGHCFVKWIYQYNNNDKQVAFCSGFRPKDGEYYYLDELPSQLKDESNYSTDYSYTIEVNESQWNKSIDARYKWKDNKVAYHLLSNNCVSFIKDIAESIGLKTNVPSGFTRLPVMYVNELEKLNSIGFIWRKWSTVPPGILDKLKRIKEWDNKTAYDHLKESVNEGCEVEIAEYDFDKDGNKAVIIKVTGKNCCNIKGECSLRVYERNGRLRLSALDDNVEKIKPAPNGIFFSNGNILELSEVN